MKRIRQLRPIADRFWEKVKKSDGCWTWTGYRDSDGYGKFWYGLGHGKEPASRSAYRLTYGDFPNDLLVCHHCDNPPCVRPDHLFLGTPRDNISDMVAKGRTHDGPRDPETASTAVLSWSLARQIRAEYVDRRTPQKELASRYGIHVSSIENLIANVTWKDPSYTPPKRRWSKPFRIVAPNGEVHEGYNLKAFCRENGLCHHNMHRMVRGFLSQHRGWTI